MKVEVAYDTSVFIQASINSVYRTIGEAVLLVVHRRLPVPAQSCAPP